MWSSKERPSTVKIVTFNFLYVFSLTTELYFLLKVTGRESLLGPSGFYRGCEQLWLLHEVKIVALKLEHENEKHVK